MTCREKKFKKYIMDIKNTDYRPLIRKVKIQSIFNIWGISPKHTE